MPIKVLLQEGRELRLRMMGEGHTSLQLFRTRLNNHPKVDYANYFPGHPVLDEPEFYVRMQKGADAAKVMQDLTSELAEEFAGLSLE